MIDFDYRFQGRMSSNKPKSDAVTGDPAFQRWLARQLHKMYDDVLAEEVPEELLRVVDRATGKPATEPGSGNGAAGPVQTTKPTKAKRDRR
jgi:hypothetical protein